MMIILKKYSEYEDDVMWQHLENVFDRIAVSDLIFVSYKIFIDARFYMKILSHSQNQLFFEMMFFIHSGLQMYIPAEAYELIDQRSHIFLNILSHYD